jgi:hypothetical protein
MGQVRRFLADTGCDVKVQPVIDPQDVPPVDSYEIPRRIREAMFLRMPASCFPYAAATGRLELDHTIAYTPQARGGPPGQTGMHGLGPFIRAPHQDARQMAGTTTRTRSVDLAITARQPLPGHQHRHPHPRHRSIRPPTLARRNNHQRSGPDGWIGDSR